MSLQPNKQTIQILTILIISVFCSCTTLKEQPIQNTISEKAILPPSSKKMVSLVFNITKLEEHQPEEILLTNTVYSAGLLKQDITIAPTIPSGKWRCSFLDQSNKVLKSGIIDDPLISNMEYVKNDSGDDFGYKEIQKKEGSFIIRTNMDLPLTKVLLEKTDKAGNPYIRKIFNMPSN